MGSIKSEYEEAVAVKSSITACHSIHPGQWHTARAYSQWPLYQEHLTIQIIYNPNTTSCHRFYLSLSNLFERKYKDKWKSYNHLSVMINFLVQFWSYCTIIVRTHIFFCAMRNYYQQFFRFNFQMKRFWSSGWSVCHLVWSSYAVTLL